jgi:hypothetical protein
MTANTDTDDDEYECTKCSVDIHPGNVTWSPDEEPYHAGCNPWRTCHKCGELTKNYSVHRGAYYCSKCPDPSSGSMIP